ncbi:uncharacterized protein TNCV_1813111 [Trichonephila clavipes]|uniref:Uncharacterized protein n=1 Tax=Trichonephila clavipes TaxID=2585209 RepID=A0A8X7BFY6_TRICX|nr:uncharacterized protein TNCV_1813111 [Trichonephila clavipes]
MQKKRVGEEFSLKPWYDSRTSADASDKKISGTAVVPPMFKEELQEILNEEHQEKQRNVSPSEQEEDERGPMPTSAIKDLFKKWDAVREMVLGGPNQADVSRVGDLNNDDAINYLRKILKKREKQSTLDMFFNAP